MNGTQVTPGGGGARADKSDRATAAIRPVDPAEQAALSDFFAALSVESRYRRFFAPVRPTHGLLDLLSGRPANVDAIVATFDLDGYFREPSGEPWVHRGHADLRKFMTQILAAGGVGIDHTTVTDDGKTCAIEFNAVRFGKHALTPQAGLAIYERGPTGRLRAARIYDDVNVEVLQAQ